MTAVASAEGRRAGHSGTGTASARGHLTEGDLAGVSLVRVIGELGGGLVPRLRTALSAAVARRAWTVVDLSLMTAVDRVALNTLVKGRCTAQGRGGDLLLVAPHDRVGAALKGARMSAAFAVFATVPQALSAASDEKSS